MTRVLFAILILAFAHAATGMHKLLTFDQQRPIAVSVEDSVLKADLKECCATEKDRPEIEKPRCLGDNCLSSPPSVQSLNNICEKIRLSPEQILFAIALSDMLRPPIV